MDDELTVIRVDAGEDVSVGDVAAAASRAGATHALVEDDGVPVSVLLVADLDEDDPMPAGERAHRDSDLSREQVRVELPDGESRDVIADVEGDLAVVEFDDERFIVSLGGEGIEGALSADAPTAFAADTRLPGPTVPTDPQTVLYECEVGHLVSQRANNPNRTCWCGHRLEAV